MIFMHNNVPSHAANKAQQTNIESEWDVSLYALFLLNYDLQIIILFHAKLLVWSVVPTTSTFLKQFIEPKWELFFYDDFFI